MDSEDWVAIDVRHPKEAEPYVQRFGADRWMSIPYEQMRNKYEQLPEGKTCILICNAGTRSYEVQVFLDARGRKNTLVLCGGLNVISRMGVSWYGGKEAQQ